MPGSDVRVTFTGDTSQLKAATDKASAAIAETGDAAAKAQAKLSSLTNETDRASQAASGGADKLGKFGSATNKAAAFLSVFSPEAAEAARSLGDMADGGELAADILDGLKVSGGAAATAAAALAVVLATVATAYSVLSNATTDAASLQYDAAAAMLDSEESAKRLADALNKVAEAHRQTSEVYADNATQIALLQGNLEQYEVEAANAAQAVRDGTAAEREALREALSATLLRLDAAEKVLSSEYALAEQRAVALAQQRELSASAQQLRADLEQLNQTTDEQAGIVSGLILQKGEQEKAEKAAAESARRASEARQRAAEREREDAELAAAAVQAREEAERRLVAWLEERAKKEKEYADGLAAIRGMEAEANADRLSEMDQLTQARDAELAELNRLLSAQWEAAKGSELRQQEIEQAGKEARLAIEERYQRDRIALVEEGNAKVSEAMEAAEREAAAAQAATQQAQIDLATSGAQTLVDLTSAIYEGKTDTGLKKGLKAAFAASKAAALAQSAINTALSVSNALATPLPPPIPQLAAAAALVSGLAATASIASTPPPSFRSGYMPDQQLAFIEPQSELVAPASAVQALGGRDAAKAAFAGVSDPGAPTVTRFTMGHREFSALVQGSARRPGPLRDLTIRPSSGRTNPHARGSNG